MNDLYAVQLVTGHFAEFIRSGQPNSRVEYLKVRRYTETLKGIERDGRWEKVETEEGPMRHLDYPSFSSDFTDLEHCAFLGYLIDYYLKGGM